MGHRVPSRHAPNFWWTWKGQRSDAGAVAVCAGLWLPVMMIPTRPPPRRWWDATPWFDPTPSFGLRLRLVSSTLAIAATEAAPASPSKPAPRAVRVDMRSRSPCLSYLPAPGAREEADFLCATHPTWPPPGGVSRADPTGRTSSAVNETASPPRSHALGVKPNASGQRHPPVLADRVRVSAVGTATDARQRTLHEVLGGVQEKPQGGWRWAESPSAEPGSPGRAESSKAGRALAKDSHGDTEIAEHIFSVLYFSISKRKSHTG